MQMYNQNTHHIMCVTDRVGGRIIRLREIRGFPSLTQLDLSHAGSDFIPTTPPLPGSGLTALDEHGLSEGVRAVLPTCRPKPSLPCQLSTLGCFPSQGSGLHHLWGRICPDLVISSWETHLLWYGWLPPSGHRQHHMSQKLVKCYLWWLSVWFWDLNMLCFFLLV